MHSTFIPADVLLHLKAVCGFMKSLPAEGAEEVGAFFKSYGEQVGATKRALAQADEIPTMDDATKLRRFLWTCRIEPTDRNAMTVALMLARARHLGNAPAPDP